MTAHCGANVTESFELFRMEECLNKYDRLENSWLKQLEYQSFVEEKEEGLICHGLEGALDIEKTEILNVPISTEGTAAMISESSEEAMSSEASEPCDLSARQDVLGKTLVRSLKRYFVKDFNSISDFKSRNQKAKTDTFLCCVKDYVKARFIDTH